MDQQTKRQNDLDDDKHIPSAGFPSVAEGEDQHQEKKSVMSKVMAKAKKIKSTLKAHGYGQGRNHDHDNNQQDRSHDEDEYDEETVQDPEEHGLSPMSDSAAVTSPTTGQKTDANLKKPTVAEDRYSKYTNAPTRPSSEWQDEDLRKPEDNAGRSSAMGVAEHVPEKRDFPLFSSTGSSVHGGGEKMEEPNIKMGTPRAVEEKPQAPDENPELPNYQTKATDATNAGGEEAGITPILRSFNKMNLDDEPDSIPPQSTTINPDDPGLLNGFDANEPQDLPKDTTVSKEASSNLGYGGNDAVSSNQGSADSIPPQTTINPNEPESTLNSFDGNKPQDMPHDTTITDQASSNPSGYTDKTFDGTSAIAEKANAAKKDAASKLGYGGNEDHTAVSSNQGAPKILSGDPIPPHTTTNPNEPGLNLNRYDGNKPQDMPQDTTITNQASSNQSGYTDKTSSGTSAIAEKTNAAKNVVASKLGYGGNEDHTAVSPNEGAPKILSGDPIPPQTTVNPNEPGLILNNFDGNKPQDMPRDTTVTNQASSNQSEYTDKTSYGTSAIGEKAIAAKNVVASQLGYGGKEDQSEASSKSTDSTQGGEEIGKSGFTGQKVIATVTEKLAPVYEKVSNVGSSVVSKVPGTGTLQERGDEEKEKRGSEKEYFAEKSRPSEEEDTPQSPVAANVSPTGKTMVETVKGAVSSWFYTGGDQKEASEPSPGTVHGEERSAAAGHGQNGITDREKTSGISN